MAADRSSRTSSFTIIKGALIDETLAAFQRWDLDGSKAENLERVRGENTADAPTDAWLRDVTWVLSRRFDPGGCDRPLVELAQAGLDRESWTPLLLWHMTRNEFLVRDFLLEWLFPLFEDGTFRLRAEDLHPYLLALPDRGVTEKGAWKPSTLKRVASGLLRIAADFGLLTGTVAREFTSYRLPDDSFLYLVHAVAEDAQSGERVVSSPEWRMFLMHPEDVERDLLRLHQFGRLEYEVAGSLRQLRLPFPTAADFARAWSQR